MTGVVVSFMFSQTTSGWFSHCLADMLMVDAQNGRHLTGEHGGLISISTGPRVAEGRNRIIDEFATKYGVESEWLLMLDTDMTFPGTLLEQLMSVADPVQVPIVGGLCFTGGTDHAPKPTIYRQVVMNKGEANEYITAAPVFDYPRDALVKVGATGAACLLMHRSALGAMKNRFEKLPDGRINPYPWFAEGLMGPNGEAWGEDVAFCLRAGSMGIPVHVLTSCRLGHIKPVQIDEVYFDNWHREKNLDDLTKVATGEHEEVRDIVGDFVETNGHDSPVPEYGARIAARQKARAG